MPGLGEQSQHQEHSEDYGAVPAYMASWCKAESYIPLRAWISKRAPLQLGRCCPEPLSCSNRVSVRGGSAKRQAEQARSAKVCRKTCCGVGLQGLVLGKSGSGKGIESRYGGFWRERVLFRGQRGLDLAAVARLSQWEKTETRRAVGHIVMF